MLMQQPWFPTTASIGLICVVIVATLVQIGEWLDNFGKTNYNWDQYHGEERLSNGTCGSGKIPNPLVG